MGPKMQKAAHQQLPLQKLIRKLAPGADLGAVESKDPRHEGQHDADAAEQAGRAAKRQLAVHGDGGKREAAANDVAAEGLRGER